RRAVEDKGAALVTDRFKAWIDRHGEGPFFAFINYAEPHADYQPPAPFREQFLAEERKDTLWGRAKNVAVQRFNSGALEYSADDLAAFNDLYDGAVAYQDSRMGEALDHLRKAGLLDRTLVIITADHGENLGDHDLLGHDFCVYNTLLHVPLIVRLPGLVPAGAATDTPVENRLLWSLVSCGRSSKRSCGTPVRKRRSRPNSWHRCSARPTRRAGPFSRSCTRVRWRRTCGVLRRVASSSPAGSSAWCLGT
ncbi:MAG: sulfatase-like hydrolase/transferase, partial [Planctomycetota bacterium]